MSFDKKIAKANAELYKIAQDNVIFEINKIASHLKDLQQIDLSEFLNFATKQYNELSNSKYENIVLEARNYDIEYADKLAKLASINNLKK